MNENMKIKYFDEELEVYDERRVVNKNTYSITLNYVPSPTRTLTVENGKTLLTETTGVPSSNQYVLDRENGLLLFNEAMKGKVMVINYSAIGLWCISADKVYTNVDNKGEIIETLEDLMRENREIIESIKTVGDASAVITQLQADIDSALGLADNIMEGSSVNEELTKTITSSKGANTTLSDTISNADAKINEMNTWVNQHGDIVNLDNRVDTVEIKIPQITEQLDKKTSKEETKNIQQQVNNLVLGAVGDGNNPEVIQARGEYTVLNERFEANEIEFNKFKGELGTTTIDRGKNILFLKDQHFESNGLTVDIKDQLITVSGQVQSTASHNFFELDIDMPDMLNGDYSVYVKVSDEQSITGRNDVLRLRFYNNEDVQVAEKSAFNHLSLTDINFLNLSNYKVKVMIQAQYTYTSTWSFNLQLASGHDGVYEKAYINRNYELNIEEDVSRLENDVNIIKSELGLDESENPLVKIITDGGLAGLIESYACCGDSLTQGVFDRTNGVAMDFNATSFNSYPSQLSRITGSKVFNLGNAGATACNSEQAIADWHSWLQTATQKNWFSDSFKPKAYIFSIGTNDIGYYGSFTGNVEADIDVNDYNNNDTTTSVGGLATMIQKARELQPKAIIFIETIDNTRNTKITRDEANEKIRAIANKLDCYLIDMAKYWVQEDKVSEWVSKYQNGGHLNAMGYLLKTQARITYIDWIIKNNPEKFKEVQFIGTTMEYK